MTIVPCWSYKVYDIDPDDDDLENELNKLGIEGWNLCGIIEDDILIFKKPSDGITIERTDNVRRKRPERKQLKERTAYSTYGPDSSEKDIVSSLKSRT